jgi:hypothetical protein
VAVGEGDGATARRAAGAATAPAQTHNSTVKPRTMRRRLKRTSLLGKGSVPIAEPRKLGTL